MQGVQVIELLKPAKDRKFRDLQTLQAAQVPVVLYGAGSYAVDVLKFLAAQKVHVTSGAVDRAYLRPDHTLLGSIPVVAIEDVPRLYGDCLVVIGFADYVTARQRLQEVGNAREPIFIDAPNQLGFFDYDYILDNRAAFEETYGMLADQRSRDIFVAFINAKMSGDPGGLYRFADFNQYFSEPVRLTDHEIFVDCGAYDGDTIRSLLRNTDGTYEKIYAFEPDDDNFRALQKNLRETGVTRVELINAGSWSGKDTLQFVSNGNMASIVPTGGDFSVAVDSIDNVMQGAPVTYIKMDIEGAELEALRGAAQTIKAHRPKLAICAYHKPEDLITLPQYIKSLASGYRFYLRHHQYMSWEMVLYALPFSA